MTLDEFVKKYSGTKVDFDKKFGYQCVDLFRQYCADVLNIPHTGAVVGAAELYTKYEVLPLEQKYFDRIPHTGDVPCTGDVVIFGAVKTNQYGHVAIVIGADDKHITVLEQDGFAQDGVHIGVWSYTRVLGFLRKKKGV